MRGAQLFEMVEKRGQPFYLIELKLYLISKSIAKALDVKNRERSQDLTTSRPLGPPDYLCVLATPEVISTPSQNYH